MKNKDYSKKPLVSEMFRRMVTSFSSAVITCEFCGRTYFINDEIEYEEKKELEDLLEEEGKDPEKYISSVCYSEWGYIDGYQIVTDCKCNNLRYYEDFIWENRRLISKYLNTRIKKRLEEASKEMEDLTIEFKEE